MNDTCKLLTIAIAACGLALVAAPESLAQGVPNDQEIVDQASGYSLDKLVELIGVYDRLGKRQVTQALADEILKRDPKNASALAVKEGRPVAPEIDPEEAGAETPQDRLANQVESLQRRHGYGELITLLNRSKKDYSGKAFPFQDDLADAYYESGNIAAAKAAYNEMVNSSKYGSSQRSMARKNLHDIENMERLAKAHELSLRGDHAEAFGIVEDLRKNHKGGNFPYENDHGDILFASGDLDGAEASYNKVASGSGYDSRQRSDAQTGLREVKKGRRMLEAHSYIKHRKLDDAMRVADELEAAGWKNDEDVALLRGEVMIEQGHHGEAIDHLTRIKEKSYKTTPFPGQSSLASAYYRSNQMREASSAYTEIVTGNYLPLEQDEAALDLRDITRQLEASLDFHATYGTEEEGDIWHLALVARSPVYANGLRIWAFADYDDLQLSDERALRADSGTRYEGGFAVEKFIDETLSVAGYIGGSHSDLGSRDNVLFGGSFVKRAGRGKWGMEFDYNERADDSIALQVLDGRQHRAQINFETPVGSRWNLDGFVYYRQVEALGEDIGDGWGGQVDFLYTVRETEKNRPAIRVGYAGEYHRFNSDESDVGSFGRYLKPGATEAEIREFGYDLVEEEINLHGLKVVFEGRVNNKVSYFVSGAAQYDFFDEELQYSAATGLEFYINDRTRFTTGVEYYSAGQTASSDAGVVLATVGLSITF